MYDSIESVRLHLQVGHSAFWDFTPIWWSNHKLCNDVTPWYKNKTRYLSLIKSDPYNVVKLHLRNKYQWVKHLSDTPILGGNFTDVYLILCN